MRFSIAGFRTVGDALLHKNNAGFEFIVQRIKYGRKSVSHIRTQKVLVESGITVEEYLELRNNATPRFIVNGLLAEKSSKR